MRLDTEVIVAGGGISGLAAAFALQQRGVRVVLLEAAARAGGTIGTVRERGCMIEAGPNSIVENTPLIGRLLDDLNLSSERVYANATARNRYVLRGGKLLALPASPGAFAVTPLFSAAAKLRLLREPFIGRPARDDEESVADFVQRRLGAEFLDYAVDPFVAGVYAGDPGKLSMAAAFPRLHALERDYGSLTRGALSGGLKRDGAQPKLSLRTLSFREGMQTLTDAIAGRLERLELSTRVINMVPDTDHHTVVATGAHGLREFRARVVLLAAPAHAAAGLVEPFSPLIAAALGAIPYAPLAVAAAAYRRSTVAHALDGFGFLVPQREGRQILGSLFSSTLFDNRAPPDRVLLTTFAGGLRQPDNARLGEAQIAALVQKEHAALLGAPAQAEFVHVKRWQRAIPQYTLGHAARIDRIEAAERDHPGLFFCCNYRGGVSVGECIESAHKSAGRIEAFLRGADAAG